MLAPMLQRTDTHSPTYRPRAALQAGAASLAVVAVLIVLKSWASWQSGSASVFGSLIDSIADASGSAMNFFAIHLSLMPADKNHRSGHGKIEGLAALLQAILILGGGVFLLVESIHRFGHGEAVADDGAALGVMAASVVLSLALVGVQQRILREAPSLAVESDRAHYGMDTVVNLGVMAVLALLASGAPRWIDPGFAVAIAGYLAWTARGIALAGLDMLLDHELPKDIRRGIRDLIMAQPGILGVHDLRTGKSGMRVFISFDIEVDPDLTLRAAHEISRDAERALLIPHPNADIMIHLDPYGDIEDSRHQPVLVHR